MKKVLAVLFTLMLAFSALTMVASAADSPEASSIIASIQIEGSGEATYSAKADNSGFKNAVSEGTMTQGVTQLSGINGPTTAEVKVLGVKSNTKGYFLFKGADGTVKRLEAVMSDGKASTVVSESGEMVLVLDNETLKNANVQKLADTAGSSATSPKTGDNSVAVIALLLVSAAAAGYSVKKIRTAE